MKILIGLAALLFIANSVFSLTGYSPLQHFENAKSRILKKHADSIHGNATSLQHMDEDYEHADDDESLENEYFEYAEKLKSRGHAPDKAASMAHTKMIAKHGKRFTSAMARQNAKGGSNLGKAAASAIFDIKIVRDTVNIPVSLPVPLFGAIHFNARYISIMGTFLPAGTTISGIAVNGNGDVVISYFNVGLNVTDTVTISCPQIPYITFLDGSKLNAQRVTKTLYQISDATKLQQFNEVFKTYDRTIYGKIGGNDLSLGSTNDPYITNFPVRQVSQKFDITYETSLVIGLVAVAGFSVNLNMSVSKYVRTNATV